MGVKGWIESFKRFTVECQRVLRVTKKPSNEEFKTVVKVSAVGLLVIGFLGFLLQIIKFYLF
ncbi:protein translocase SEC61 complex subunit gamma [Candidatus Woesearchaeota archaeon]|nr:protein translocase SEC61 complex subunit gamma [Candidatus Woesearchaeota archaeon]HIH38836.1 protein translocase SEC61 complex subunit gamma [Candidatus Woesearchaeota archaeon]HIH48905.1 protein translocase SEC61 complex subunit gamma [Candidatus Woesearchaeota archaeon]HIJ04341.1 protein translocase SEC61 complex subunit gamma [Candidatus Woesearchaeota archaeon]